MKKVTEGNYELKKKTTPKKPQNKTKQKQKRTPPKKQNKKTRPPFPLSSSEKGELNTASNYLYHLSTGTCF